MENNQVSLIKFVAFFKSARLISVSAVDRAAAVREVEQQLNRPGRYGEYRAWVDGGRVVLADSELVDGRRPEPV